MLTLAPLSEAGTVRHAFFTRLGGVSEGIFAALNCGFGSGDDRDRVAANRARAMAQIDLPAPALVTAYQVHSDRVATVNGPFATETAPQVDGLVTRAPGVALGILTADCAPVLFADPAAGVVGAAHAGWRGARAGILERTVAAMTELGASRGDIMAAIGPCIAQPSYEVGPEFEGTFLEESAANRDFFKQSSRPGHRLFDLGGYVERRLGALGLGQVCRAVADTCGDESQFFSYRRSVLRGEGGYGRGLSAIALVD